MKNKILVVEDGVTLLEMLEYNLARQGYEVLKVSDGRSALTLARHPGIALSRDLILERVWGWAYDGNSRTVDVHVRWLREKIEEDPSQLRRIQTVRSIGYRFDG